MSREGKLWTDKESYRRFLLYIDYFRAKVGGKVLVFTVPDNDFVGTGEVRSVDYLDYSHEPPVTWRVALPSGTILTQDSKAYACKPTGKCLEQLVAEELYSKPGHERFARCIELLLGAAIDPDWVPDLLKAVEQGATAVYAYDDRARLPDIRREFESHLQQVNAYLKSLLVH